ncbi:hypothetical protein Q669_29410 [Labrenzia sp. C1B10]|uniref:hypothetical protein n=1 Tax=unclassified Labrenzia TaxID=2648686 RepID=UPI0003B86BB8|nr:MULTISPECIES: hypothetical protein [unclassified Labrenzia]ERP95689.1 hypothetical protein Q669_29410 [Labrenzia sp. C1B10]ERS05755.1 hypothetical protein Q675_28975 [Labrenzia sp. C1B70]
MPVDTELKIAVNQIEYSYGKKRKIAEPGAPFQCPVSEVDYLERVGAVRDLTEAEQALWERQNSKKPAPEAAEDEDENDGQGGGNGDGDSDTKDGDAKTGEAAKDETDKETAKSSGRTRGRSTAKI